MFTASNTVTRLASFTFAVLMVIAVNGSMLMKFDSVATSASMAQSAKVRQLAVFETVTVVGRRISASGTGAVNALLFLVVWLILLVVTG